MRVLLACLGLLLCTCRRSHDSETSDKASKATERQIAERYGVAVGPDWHPDTLQWDAWPVDVSFLNDGDRPAGRHGRVRARGQELVFDDGTPARFWGTNIQAYALFQATKPAIARQAKRLAALGYNLVRIHHHDSDWVEPNVFAKGDTTQTLDDTALDSIDWWVSCLRDEGIYVWMDLKVGRVFRRGDGIEGFDELTKAQPSGKGFDYVDPQLEQLEHRFAEQYLARVNRYTGRSYLDDPAVIGTLVTNEDDLNTHHASLMLADKGHPVHRGMFEALVEASAKRIGVSKSKALKTWEPGPSKIVLADLEARFFGRAIGHLRGLGFQGLVAPTSYWGDESLFALSSLTVGDVIDVHSYGEAESLGQDPRTGPNFISYIAAASVGKPVVVTEWNVEYPKRDRFVAPLYVAAVASLQGWDAPMLYGYLQHPLVAPDRVDPWSTASDPAITAAMPAAAVMFRQRHVREAVTTYRVELDRDRLYDRPIGPRNSVALRTLAEQSRLVVALPDLPELPWDGTATADAREPATVVTDPDKDFVPAGQKFVVSDTGELKRDWSIGVETIDTPRSQAAMGWIGGAPIALGDVTFRIRTPKATVAVTSLDWEPIARSRRMLLTVVAQVAASPGEKLPFLAQPVVGSISIRTDALLRLIPLLAGGSDAGLSPVAGSRRQNETTFEIPSELATHWFLLAP